MKRRLFNRLIPQFALSQVLLTSLLQSCREEEEEVFVPFDGEIVIIGAGIAGLYTANILISQGYRCTVLEASNSIGGRLQKDENFADFPIDLGAQWLHGKNNILGDIIEKTKTPIHLDNSEEWLWFDQKIQQDLPKDLFELFRRDNDIPDISFQNFATQNGFDNTYSNLVEAIAGDSGASGDKISAYWKIKEEENWSSGDEDYKFQETYFDLIVDNFGSQIAPYLKLNTPIKTIDYSAEKIRLTAVDGSIFSADKVIVTAPISILKSGMIGFIPDLPEPKLQAFQKIGMEEGMKVFLKFTQPFYKENLLGGQLCGAYIDERIGKNGNDNVLMAFLMGKQARELSAMGDESIIIQALLAELDLMYNGQASIYFQQGLVKNWGDEPYIKGAYSYSTVGIGDARHQASSPVDKKLYFAGEAMNTDGHHQTVFGAAETGKKAIEQLFKDL